MYIVTIKLLDTMMGCIETAMYIVTIKLLDNNDEVALRQLCI